MTPLPIHVATVIRSRSLTPRMQRVTLGGSGLAGFAGRNLPDERVKLLLPRPGGGRPVSRTLTVRRFDPDANELDLDIALHDGAAATWAREARSGEQAEIAGPWGGYRLSSGHHLVVGDEAALPCIATILERLLRDASADVIAELGDPSGMLDLERPARTRLTWLHRNGRGTEPGELLVQAVRDFDWPRSAVRVWAAGEALAMRALRRHLRDDLRLPRDSYQVVGYWRRSLTEEQAIEAHMAAQERARAAGAGDDEVDDAGLY